MYMYMYMYMYVCVYIYTYTYTDTATDPPAHYMFVLIDFWLDVFASSSSLFPFPAQPRSNDAEVIVGCCLLWNST